MNTDNKTLADVQPGGRVRLGNVRDRVMGECEQWFDTSDVDMEAATDSIIAAAQPSPGGQDALAALQRDYDKLLDSFNRQVEVAEKIAGRALQQDDRIEELEEALAACQPVTMDDALAAGDGTLHGAIDHWQERALRAEAELAARQPVGEPVCADCGTQVLFECTGCSRSNYPTYMQGAIGEIVYSGEGGLQIEFYDGKPLAPMKLYAAPPVSAQAVDLDAMRALLQRRIEQWRSHLPADPGAPGTREIETKGEHDYNNDVRIYREGIAVMEEVLSKIDSQAVGNG